MKNDNKVKAYVPFVLSETDLMLLDGYSPELSVSGHAALGAILYKNGMDVINYPVTIRECLHRPLSSPTKVVQGRMFCGAERLDRLWNQTGAMSLEAVIASMADTETRKEMVEMATIARFEE